MGATLKLNSNLSGHVDFERRRGYRAGGIIQKLRSYVEILFLPRYFPWTVEQKIPPFILNFQVARLQCDRVV
jgi:hypothetical protein